MESDYVLGIAAFWQGEFAAARRHFEAAVAHYRPQHRHDHLVRYGTDPKVICLSRLGNTLWFLGHLEAATRARDTALALAEEIGHPDSRATALLFAAILALDMRDQERVREYTAALRAGRGEHQARQTQVSADALCGYVDVLDGQVEAGIARIQRALDDLGSAQHAPGMRAFIVHLLLEAHAAADARAGLEAAERALRTGSAGIWEADARRLRAQFLAALDASREEVEAELELALAIARRQGARSLELRVAASLLRYRRACGDGPGARKAREQVAAIVERLHEEEESADLQEALALLG